MAWLDRVKNLTGLVRWFCENPELRQMVNLLVVGGDRYPNKSMDAEEAKEIEAMNSLVEEYNLFGQFRWVCTQTSRVRNGELYRYIADTRGVFVQVRVLELKPVI
jgi:sucrose synthase